MQFAQIIQRAAFLAKQAGWDEALPSPDFKDLVNKAYVDFSWDTEFYNDTATFTTTAGTAQYTIALPYFKTVKDCSYSVSGQQASVLTATSESDERKFDQLWFARPSGTPVRYMMEAPNVMRLVEIPAATGATVTVRGTRVAPALSADSDLPAFPDTWHEALALRAAVLFCEPWVDEAGAARINLYREQYSGMVRECVLYMSSQRYESIQRTVRRPSRRRTSLSAYARRI